MLSVTLPPALSLKEKRIVSGLDPLMQVKAVEHYDRLAARSIRLQYNSGRRTDAQQARIVEQTQQALASTDSVAALRAAGLTGITASKKRSLHLFGLAYDGEPFPKTEANWLIYGEEAEAIGLRWGGRWRRTLSDGTVTTDRPHVQFPGDSDTLRNLAGAGLLGVATFAIVKLVAHRILNEPTEGT